MPDDPGTAPISQPPPGRSLTNRERQAEAEAAWQGFIERGQALQGLSPQVLASWLRSRDTFHIDPWAKAPRQSLAAEALLERLERDDLLQVASPILRDFSDRLSLSDHVLACFDGQGWMLSIQGEPSTIDQLTEVSFRPGVNWSESSAGTNGPGTALAGRAPAEIFAGEHFVKAWHPFSGAAVPVFDPGGAEPAGVIVLTGPWEVRRRQALSMTKALARAVEERLRAVSAVREEVVRYAFRVARDAGYAVVAVDRRGRVQSANDAASRRQLVVEGALAPALRQVVSQALATPGASTELVLKLDGEAQPVAISPVHYEGAAVGAVLRIPPRSSAVRAHPPAPGGEGLPPLLGRSGPWLRVLDLARGAGENDLPVVIGGEPGTGKELLARVVHASSARSGGPLVVVSCGLPPARLDDELFGSGAVPQPGGPASGTPGRIREAQGGSLVLAEVGELPLATQAALVRVLDEGTLAPARAGEPRRIDVRVIALTSLPLSELVASGRFRADLFYRLQVLTIDIPPLRARREDLGVLAEAFLARAAAEAGRGELRLTEGALAALRAHPWKGNVRELRNTMARAAGAARGSVVDAEHLLLAPSTRSTEELREALADSERESLRARLERAGWRFARVARELGISRMTLYRRAHRYGLTRPGGER